MSIFNFNIRRQLIYVFLFLFHGSLFAQNKPVERIEEIVINSNFRKIKESNSVTGEYVVLYGDYSGKCGDYKIEISNASFFEGDAGDFSLNDVRPARKGKFILKNDSGADFYLTDYFFNKFKSDYSGIYCIVFIDKKFNPILLMWTANGGNTFGWSNIASLQKIDLKTKKITLLGTDPKQISKKLGFDIKSLKIIPYLD
jgi:hypothetical protein